MKNIFLIVFCLLVSTVWAKEEKNKRIQYCTTLEEAMQQAARKHKPIFFNCYAGWAGPSVLMDSVVLTDPDLVSFIQKHFVSLRVDMPKTQEGRKLAERYRVKFYAHYLILDEKVALMDTVDTRGVEQWEKNLLAALDGRKVDYLIVSHLEPDHAGRLGPVQPRGPGLL